MYCLYIVLSGHTSMLYMPYHPMVEVKIKNLLPFCPKLIISIKNYGGHFGFMEVTKFPQGFHSGNPAKFVLQMHVTTKP